MTAAEKIHVLKNHNIKFKLRKNKKILAKDEFINAKKEYGFNWVDVTEWNRRDMMDWLNF